MLKRSCERHPCNKKNWKKNLSGVGSLQRRPLLTRNFKSGMWHDVKILPLMLSALKIESPEAKWSLWSGSISISFGMHKGAAQSRTSASLEQSSRWQNPPCSSLISLEAKRTSKEKHHLADPEMHLWCPPINLFSSETKLGSKPWLIDKKSCPIELHYRYSETEERFILLFFFSANVDWLIETIFTIFLLIQRGLDLRFRAPWSSLNSIQHDFATKSISQGAVPQQVNILSKCQLQRKHMVFADVHTTECRIVVLI